MFSIAIAIAADCKQARFFSSIRMQTFWVVTLTARYSVANASTGWGSWVNYKTTRIEVKSQRQA